MQNSIGRVRVLTRGRAIDPAHHGNRNRYRHPGTPRDSFSTMVRLIYKMIQSLHHLQILEGKIPRGIEKQVNKLTKFIRPANPSQETLCKIATNANTWARETRQILIEHYQSSLRDLERKFKESDLTDR